MCSCFFCIQLRLKPSLTVFHLISPSRSPPTAWRTAQTCQSNVKSPLWCPTEERWGAQPNGRATVGSPSVADVWALSGSWRVGEGTRVPSDAGPRPERRARAGEERNLERENPKADRPAAVSSTFAWKKLWPFSAITLTIIMLFVFSNYVALVWAEGWKWHLHMHLFTALKSLIFISSSRCLEMSNQLWDEFDKENICTSVCLRFIEGWGVFIISTCNP